MKLYIKHFPLCLGVIVVILISISCSKKSVEIPDDILSKQELVPVLVDIQLAQAAIAVNQPSDSSRFSMNDYSAHVFNSHHITKEKYDSSIAFYTQHPELIDAIYQEVINELSKKQSEAERK